MATARRNDTDMVECHTSWGDYVAECSSCWLGHAHDFGKHRANIARAQAAARTWRAQLQEGIDAGSYSVDAARRYYDVARRQQAWSLSFDAAHVTSNDIRRALVRCGLEPRERLRLKAYRLPYRRSRPAVGNPDSRYDYPRPIVSTRWT